jgi:DNA-directed RNA polymerase specialized sigma24 family protein
MLAGSVADPTEVTLNFDDFFQAEYRGLLALATALCGSRAIGEDVVQEAMFAASRQWEKISHYDDPAQWARGVVARQASNVRRGRFREGRAVRRLAGRRDVTPTALPQLEGDAFWNAVRALPRRQRECVTLHYLDDLTTNEIAAAAAIVVLGGGAVAVAATRGDDKKRPDQVAVNPTDERLNPDAIDKMDYLYTQGSQFATSADWVHTTVDGKPALLLDVHGQFKLQPPCPNGRDCATYGTNNLLTLDASDGNFDVLDSKVSDKATDLSAYGHVNHVTLPFSHLEFREVVGSLPWSGPQGGSPTTTAQGCESGKQVTPATDITPEATQIVLPDTEPHQVCYVVGASVLDRPDLAGVDVRQDPQTNDWQLLVHFPDDSFIQQVAQPLVGKNVAIVVDNVVLSAPTINEGITGRDIQIAGSFTEDQARQLAAGLIRPGVSLETTNG